MDKKKFFGSASNEYKWAAKQPYGHWALFINKPKFNTKENRWEDAKDNYSQATFFPASDLKIDSKKSLIKRYSFFCCC